MLYDKVYNFITENNLITKKTVICATSGGADSVCLLDVMLNIALKLGVKVECAHLNHNLRGAESDADEEYVRSLCEKFEVPLHIKSVRVGDISKGVGIEDAARRARYTFFDELAQNRSVQILTAHTVNDNTETFFINLLRGSGSRGLCAIPVSRANVVRPLLCVTRDEIIEHLRERNLDYRTDSSNFDTSYLRNFIRHEIIPQFFKRSDIDIHRSVAKAVNNLALENCALDDIADLNKTDDVGKLSKLPDAVLYRVLNKQLEKLFDITLDSVHFNAVKSLFEKGNSRVQIQGDIYAVCEYGKLFFECCVGKNNLEIVLKNGENSFNGKTILIKSAKEIYNTLTNNAVDCDRISNTLYVRTRRDGDIFYHKKRPTTHLKKLFINDKVAKSRRDSLAVICDGNGDIVFVEDYGVDKRFAADSNSKNIIEISIIK